MVIRIVEFPDADIEREMGLQSPYDLLGLYQGVSLDRKSVAFADQDVDMIDRYDQWALDSFCYSCSRDESQEIA